jgi:hypothetical protein
MITIIFLFYINLTNINRFILLAAMTCSIFIIRLYILGLFENGYPVACCYGRYGPNVLGLFDSSVDSYEFAWSSFFPNFTGAGGWEPGFIFLGTTACILLIIYSRDIYNYWFGPVGVTITVMAPIILLAVTHEINLGAFSIVLPIPQSLINVMSAIRGSGRLFWPIYFLLIAFVITLYFRRALRLRALPFLITTLLLVFFTLSEASNAIGYFRQRFLRTEIHAGSIDSILNFCKVNTCNGIGPIQLGNALHNWKRYALTAVEIGIPTKFIYVARFKIPHQDTKMKADLRNCFEWYEDGWIVVLSKPLNTSCYKYLNQVGSFEGDKIYIMKENK